MHLKLVSSISHEEIVDYGQISVGRCWTDSQCSYPEDMDYRDIANLSCKELPHDQICCDMENTGGGSCYEPLDFIVITRKECLTFVEFEVNLRFSKWQGNMDVNLFARLLREKMRSCFGLRSEMHELMEEDMLHIKFFQSALENQEISSIVDIFCNNISSIHNKLIPDESANEIHLSQIVMSGEHLGSKFHLLNFVQILLTHKLPNKDIVMTAVQSATDPKLVLQYPREYHAEIKEYMHSFADVLENKKTEGEGFKSAFLTRIYQTVLERARRIYVCNLAMQELPDSVGQVKLQPQQNIDANQWSLETAEAVREAFAD